MDMTFSDSIEAFRQEVRAILRESVPDDIKRAVAAERMDLPGEMQRRWQGILHTSGWSCPAWPETYGGTGWSDEQLYVFERELALADALRPNPYGVVMLGPAIIEFGTEAQKQRFLPGILSGEVLWCQGFSEPNAGSDLAALQCKAERDGDHYRINGSKIWTSDAHVADWIFGLYRTDTSGRKQQGITFLLIDLSSPGVTITPLITYEGTLEVNQVFFDDVRVPTENRLGAEHEGWSIAKYVLGLERFGTAEVSRSMASLERLKAMAATAPAGGQPLIEDPAFADKLAAAEIALRAVEITEQRFLFGPGGANALGPEASMLKIRGSEVQQQILELSHEALGSYAQVDLPEGPEAEHEAEALGLGAMAHAGHAHFNFRKASIYSGSNEIQKNIIAKAALGL